VVIQKVAEIVGELTLLRFFPSDPIARTALVREICDMAASEDQVRWLITRMLKLYQVWPGLGEVRATFCSKFKPRDGVERYSEVYPDGIPSERLIGDRDTAQRQITGEGRLQIAGKVERMPEADIEQLHNETIGALLESSAPIQPGRRDWIAAKRLAAILDGRGEEAARLTAQLAAMNPRTREERDAIKEAEREIAEAKPTLTEEEKARRVTEIETALGKSKSA
jgi:hypothetical protein